MSEDDPIKAAEARGYAKGYGAGKRRAERDDRAEDVRGRRERFRQDVYLAIISEMIRSPWGRKIDGTFKPFSGAKEISGCAWNFADEAVKRASFL